MNDEELLRRMQIADPARTTSLADSWIPDLVEATLSGVQEPQTGGRRWVRAVAAAVVVAAVGAGAYTLLGQERDADPEDQISLTLPDPNTALGSCIVFSVDILKDMPLAFSGTATDVGEGSVTVSVDHWYKGGDADLVILNHYSGPTVSIDGFEFSEDGRYLITATDGTVNFCGYSAPWSAQLAAQFELAFGA